jgi:FMN phosphatase YigB (HAD superfamily)
VDNRPGGIRDVISDVAKPSSKPVLVLDFDGTICLGDGPVLAYGTKAFALLPPPIRELAHDQLRRYLAGDQDLVRRYPDGYSCVRGQTLGHLSHGQLTTAYLASRLQLASDDLGTYLAAGVTELLINVGRSVTRMVLTNAPAVGVTETLERFGLSGLLDQVVVRAHKPIGMSDHLDILTSGREPATLISVGDHWANDIAIPLRRGCATAFVTPQPRTDEPSHVHGTKVADLIPAIITWARDPAAFVHRHGLEPEVLP